MKRIIIASLCLIFSVLCYGKMENRILHRSYIDHSIYEDSAKVAIKVKVDSAVRAIAVTYDAGLSFNETESMIRMAKRKHYKCSVLSNIIQKKRSLYSGLRSHLDLGA